MQFKAYMIIAVIVTSIIYPVVGHWGWGGAILEGETGWLAEKGFIDFAGSTIVHSVGAWIGLAGAIIVGARVGRFDQNGKPVEMQPFSQTYIALGVFILDFGVQVPEQISFNTFISLSVLSVKNSIPDSTSTTQVPHSPSLQPNGNAEPLASTISCIVLPSFTFIAKKSLTISTLVVILFSPLFFKWFNQNVTFD
jgi:hypothetical protein